MSFLKLLLPLSINGNIRKLEKINLTYIETHKFIIKNITGLVFVYIFSLTTKINYQNCKNI